MGTVKVPPKLQVVIPRRVREQLGIEPGQRMQVLIYNNHRKFIPLKPIERARGILKGIDAAVRREKTRL
jgi:AbrB family looped-hinge helix DNA binding protein